MKKWQDYESRIFEILSAYHLHDKIERNVKIKGRYSKRSRQIDIYISQTIHGHSFTTVIECKYYNKKIDVKTVESFISMVDDIGADYGILVTELGYSKSAFLRAANNPKGIDLDIYDLNAINSQLQAEGAIPHAGGNGALILAPFGWTVDAKRREVPVLCFLYKKGLSFEEAIGSGEFAYVDFWNLTKKHYSIQELSKLQESNLGKEKEITAVEYLESANALGYECMVRIIRMKDFPLIEIAGLIKFKDFIFFCICNTPTVFEKRNLRKMHLLLKQILPFKVNHE